MPKSGDIGYKGRVIFGEISENKNIPMTFKTQTLSEHMVDTLDHSYRNML